MTRTRAVLAAILSCGPVLSTAALAQGPSGYGGLTSSGVSGPQFGGDQLYPYESQSLWQHGYFQEMPAYGGYHAFAPYNYKHVLSQTQTAAGFGMSPVMPYSQQFWHRYENRANLSPYAHETAAPTGTPMPLPGVPYTALPVGPRPMAVPGPWPGGPVIVPAAGEQRDNPGRWGRHSR